MSKRKVYGVGFDSGGIYPVMDSPNVKSKCYNVWKDMLRRGYSESYKEKRPTYKDVNVCEEWHDYQSFATWFYNNYKDGYQLDKDLIVKDNKTYCPEFCRFIPQDLNSLLVNRVGSSRNYELPLGVCWSKDRNKYTAWCNNGEGKTINLGSRDTPEEAFALYKEYKENLIKSKASKYYSEGVIDKKLYNSLLIYVVEPQIM